MSDIPAYGVGMGTQERITALDALRAWAATDRAALVAAAWRAGNRNIAELARVAGVHRDTIYQDLRAHSIDPTTSREEPPTMPTATDFVELPVPGWRHPNLVTVHKRRTSWGVDYKIDAKPFTGTEPEPTVPKEWDAMHPSESNDWRPSSQRQHEINLIRRVWAKARYDHQVGQMLKKSDWDPYQQPAEHWAEFVAARDALQAAYKALATTPDNMWKSALLAIVDAKARATKAADTWDRCAFKFAELDLWLLRAIGEDDYPTNALGAAAAKHNVDTGEWLIESPDDYTSSYRSMPAVDKIEKIIKEGDERVKQVDDYFAER